MTKVLLVDAGGVLFNNINEETAFAERLATRHGADPHLLLQKILENAHQYERGARSAHDVMREALAESRPRHARNYDPQWVDRIYLDSLKCYQRNLDAVAEVLQANPQMQAVLANNEAEHWDRLKDEYFDHYRHFDRLCSSWRVGEVKPSPAYFAAVLQQCDVRPSDMLMIDDRATVIEVAERMGMRSLHVQSPDAMPQSLRAALS